MRALVLLLVALGDPGTEAKGFLDRWLAAQNRGDFAAYQALYAARMTGVRRSGARTVHLDRAGWMRDRERMFAKKMVVSIEDVQIAPGPAAVRLHFVQRFASGNYQDAGPKEMVLVREAGGWRIAREELLSSELSAGSPAATTEGQLALAIESGVVLAAHGREDWAFGPPELLSDRDVIVSARKIVRSRLPEALGRWQGRKVRLFGAAGRSCEATIEGFRLVAREVPHFGMREQWKGKPRAAIAAEAWSESESVLVGTLGGGCSGLVARAADLPAVPVTEAAPPDTALRTAALREFRRLPAYAEIQKSFREDHAEGAWDQRADDVRLEVRLLRAPGRTIVSVSAMGGAGCGGFEGQLSAFWELTGEGAAARLAPRGAFQDYRVPVLGLDSDRDGALEIVYRGSWLGDFLRQGLLRLRAGEYRPAETLEIAYHDCPC